MRIDVNLNKPRNILKAGVLLAALAILLLTSEESYAQPAGTIDGLTAEQWTLGYELADLELLRLAKQGELTAKQAELTLVQPAYDGWMALGDMAPSVNDAIGTMLGDYERLTGEIAELEAEIATVEAEIEAGVTRQSEINTALEAAALETAAVQAAIDEVLLAAQARQAEAKLIAERDQATDAVHLMATQMVTICTDGVIEPAGGCLVGDLDASTASVDEIVAALLSPFEVDEQQPEDPDMSTVRSVFDLDGEDN